MATGGGRDELRDLEPVVYRLVGLRQFLLERPNPSVHADVSTVTLRCYSNTAVVSYNVFDVIKSDVDVVWNAGLAHCMMSCRYLAEQNDLTYCEKHVIGSVGSHVLTGPLFQWLGGLLVERRTSVSQIHGSIPGQVAAV